MRSALLAALSCGCAAHVPLPVTDAEPPHVATVSVPADAPLAAPASSPVAADAPTPEPMALHELEQALARSCTACHSPAYVQQQRMTSAQWMATLTKMRSWGAIVDEGELPRLAEALAAQRGPTASLPALELVEILPFRPPASKSLPRAALGRGKALFAARCVACHGADARGGLGVNLGDEQLLQEPHRFAATVRAGRGLMPPSPDLTDAQLAELRAWLETL